MNDRQHRVNVQAVFDGLPRRLSIAGLEGHSTDDRSKEYEDCGQPGTCLREVDRHYFLLERYIIQKNLFERKL